MCPVALWMNELVLMTNGLYMVIYSDIFILEYISEIWFRVRQDNRSVATILSNTQKAKSEKPNLIE